MKQKVKEIFPKTVGFETLKEKERSVVLDTDKSSNQTLRDHQGSPPNSTTDPFGVPVRAATFYGKLVSE